MKALKSNFYLIRVDDTPVYVGYTNRPIKTRFREHLHDKDFGDGNVTVEDVGSLSFDFTWDINLINQYAQEVSKRETALIAEYGTATSIWQRGIHGDIGGQVWANVKHFVRTNRDNPKFTGMDESEILAYLDRDNMIKIYMHSFVSRIDDPIKDYMRGFVSTINDPVNIYMRGFTNRINDPVKIYIKNFVNDVNDPVKIYMKGFTNRINDPVKIYMSNFVGNMNDSVELYMKHFITHINDPVKIYMQHFVSAINDPVKDYMKHFITHINDPVKDYMSNFVSRIDDPVKDYMRGFIKNMQNKQ